MSGSKHHRLRWWLLSAVLLALVWGGLELLAHGFELKDLVDLIAGFNPVVVFILMATLPVAGFSVSIVYLVAGIKFGPYLGGVAVTAATVVHLVATHWVCRSILREPLRRFLARRKHRLPHIPPGENASIAAMAALVPGLPYFARNYLLALSEVPLRVYFWICLPIYVIRSYVAILVGDLGGGLDWRNVSILAAVYAVKLSICAWLIWRIRRRFKEAKAAPETLHPWEPPP